MGVGVSVGVSVGLEVSVGDGVAVLVGVEVNVEVAVKGTNVEVGAGMAGVVAQALTNNVSVNKEKMCLTLISRFCPVSFVDMIILKHKF